MSPVHAVRGLLKEGVTEMWCGALSWEAAPFVLKSTTHPDEVTCDVCHANLEARGDRVCERPRPRKGRADFQAEAIRLGVRLETANLILDALDQSAFVRALYENWRMFEIPIAETLGQMVVHVEQHARRVQLHADRLLARSAEHTHATKDLLRAEDGR